MKQRFPLAHAALASAVAATLTMPAFADSARSTSATQQKPDAQGTTAATHGTIGGAALQLRDDVRVSQVIGIEIRDRRGEKLGKLKDLVLDLSQNRVHYAVLQPEGSDQLFALPARIFESRDTSNHLVVDAQRSDFANASGFNERWPGMEDARYWSNVQRQLGDQMALQPGQHRTLRRASELLKTDIVGRAGDGIGEVRDVVVNFSNGAVHYLVADFDSPRMPEALVALPIGALEPSYGRDALMLNLSAAQVATAPTFSEQRWPDLADENFHQRVARTLTETPAQTGSAANITGMETPARTDRQGSESSLTGVQGRSPLNDPGVARAQEATQMKSQPVDQASQEPQRLGRGVAPPEPQIQSPTAGQIPQPLGQAQQQPNQTSPDAMKQAPTPATVAPQIDARPFNDESFKRLDRDGDGRISAEEARMDPTFMAAWHELDRGNSGFVTLDDVRSYRDQKGLR